MPEMSDHHSWHFSTTFFITSIMFMPCVMVMVDHPVSDCFCILQTCLLPQQLRHLCRELITLGTTPSPDRTQLEGKVKVKGFWEKLESFQFKMAPLKKQKHIWWAARSSEVTPNMRACHKWRHFAASSQKLVHYISLEHLELIRTSSSWELVGCIMLRTHKLQQAKLILFTPLDTTVAIMQGQDM